MISAGCNRFTEDGVCYLCLQGKRKAGQLRCDACADAVRSGVMFRKGKTVESVAPFVRRKRARLAKSGLSSTKTTTPPDELVNCRAFGCEWSGERRALWRHMREHNR